MWQKKIRQDISPAINASAFCLVVTFSDFVDLGKMYVLDVPSCIYVIISERFMAPAAEAVERTFLHPAHKINMNTSIS